VTRLSRPPRRRRRDWRCRPFPTGRRRMRRAAGVITVKACAISSTGAARAISTTCALRPGEIPFNRTRTTPVVKRPRRNRGPTSAGWLLPDSPDLKLRPSSATHLMAALAQPFHNGPTDPASARNFTPGPQQDTPHRPATAGPQRPAPPERPPVSAGAVPSAGPPPSHPRRAFLKMGSTVTPVPRMAGLPIITEGVAARQCAGPPQVAWAGRSFQAY
jgi:hypothetical protein